MQELMPQELMTYNKARIEDVIKLIEKAHNEIKFGRTEQNTGPALRALEGAKYLLREKPRVAPSKIERNS